MPIGCAKYYEENAQETLETVRETSATFLIKSSAERQQLVQENGLKMHSRVDPIRLSDALDVRELINNEELKITCGLCGLLEFLAQCWRSHSSGPAENRIVRHAKHI